MQRIVFTLILALAPLLVQAQMYKWVDENGRTQYSDRPPPAGVKSEQVTKGKATPTPAPASSAPGAPAKGGPGANTAAGKELDFRKRQMSADEQQKDDEKKARDQQAKQENCDIARARMKSLEDGGRILKYDKAGDRQYMSDEEIAKEKAPAQQRVDQACK